MTAEEQHYASSAFAGVRGAKTVEFLDVRDEAEQQAQAAAQAAACAASTPSPSSAKSTEKGKKKKESGGAFAPAVVAGVAAAGGGSNAYDPCAVGGTTGAPLVPGQYRYTRWVWTAAVKY